MSLETSVSTPSAPRSPAFVAALALAGITVSLQQTLVVPLVPQFPRLLGASAADTAWVVTATLLTAAVATPVVGRLADMVGKMLALGILALVRHPDQLALVRGDPDAVAPAVEELLRWLTIVNSGSPRLARKDVEIGGATIRRGDLVVFNLPAANRDRELIADPERLDVTRAAAAHVAFGHGVHHCLGAPLARLEMRVAFPALLRRFPGLRLAVPDDEVRFASHRAIHGLVELPVIW